MIAFLHIIIHAFFKSILFLATGSMIHNLERTQDSRSYGRKQIIYSAMLFFLVSCLCLRGFPFLIGFYSKDFIISNTSLKLGLLIYATFLLGCLMTILYRIRLFNRRFQLILKSPAHFSFRERFQFFSPVSLLFLKGWLLGGSFY